MRIVHILTSLGVGGQERVALDLAAGQTALGHQVTTLAMADGPLRREYEDKALDVRIEPKTGSGFDWSLSRRLSSAFAASRVEVVHTHNPVPLYYAAGVARLQRLRLIHTKHGANPVVGRKRWMLRACGHLVDAYVACSEATGEVARREHECWPGRLRVIPNGTDLSRFAPSEELRRAVRKELGISESAFVVGTVGRVCKEKAHVALARALQADVADDYQLVIVGGGPQEAELAEVVAQGPRPDAMHLLGIRPDVPRLVCAFDVFVLPSLTEGLPIVLLEAMAAGLPVVASAVGGVPDLILAGKTGYLFERADMDAMRERLFELRDHPQLRVEMAARAQKIAREHYASERMVRDYLELYGDTR